MEEKLSMESKNILSENIENVASLFPNALVETEDGKKIDFDILRQELSGDIVEGTKERYHLDFPGKREAIVEANRKINKTLRPIKEKSVDFDNTKNIYIEGDNLEALKILQESYLGKIKCIYIDPPYNTGNDFVYNDKFSHTTEEELKASGRMDEDGNVLISKDINNDSNGRYHSDWLKMMYPRLKLARNLLSDDGVIFISIDENELENLIKLCDEIFSESNRVTTFTWEKTQHMGRQKVNYYSNIEYILCYCKNIKSENGLREILVENISNDLDDAPLYNDSNPEKELVFPIGSVKFNIKDGEYNISNDNKYKLLEPVIVKDSINKNELKLKFRSRWTSKTVLEEYEKGCRYWVKTQNFAIRTIYQADKTTNVSPKQMIFTNKNNEMCAYSRINLKVGTNEEGSSELSNLFGVDAFSYPKPTSLIIYLISLIFDSNKNKFLEDFIFMDFFSGSGTSAESIFKLNSISGNRRFILVQLQESLDEALKNASKENEKQKVLNQIKICDELKQPHVLTTLAEERIRRAGKKIKEENPMLTQNLDTGFRVYKVDSSNMKDIYYMPNEIKQSDITNFISNVKKDRTAEDLLTQVILNLGLPLDLHIDEKMVGKNKLFFVEENALVACFDETIDLKLLDEIEKVQPLKICLRESSFTKDQDKINFFEKLKKISPDTEANII